MPNVLYTLGSVTTRFKPVKLDACAVSFSWLITMYINIKENGNYRPC